MTLKRFIITILAGFIIAVLAILTVARFYGVNLTDIVKAVNVETFAIFIVLLLVAETLRAYRLKLLVSRHNKCSLSSSIIGRWTGSLLSVSTPTIGGGEAVRGVVAARTISAQAIGSGVVDGALDFIANYLLAIFFLPLSPLLYPNTIHVIVIALLIALPAFLFWLLTINNSKHDTIVKKLPFANRIGVDRLKKLVTSIELDKSLFVKTLILTVIAWSLDALNLAYFASQTSTTGFIDAYIALVYSLLLGVLPTPGGAGPVDSLLATLINPTTAISWRLLRAFVLATGGSIAFVLALTLCRPTLVDYLSKRHNNC